MAAVFVGHVLAGHEDPRVARQQIQPVALQLVLARQGDRTPPAAAPRVIVRQAARAEDAVARAQDREPERLGAADAGAVIGVGEENGWRQPQRRALVSGRCHAVAVDDVRLPRGQIGKAAIGIRRRDPRHDAGGRSRSPDRPRHPRFRTSTPPRAPRGEAPARSKPDRFPRRRCARASARRWRCGEARSHSCGTQRVDQPVHGKVRVVGGACPCFQTPARGQVAEQPFDFSGEARGIGNVHQRHRVLVGP